MYDIVHIKSYRSRSLMDGWAHLVIFSAVITLCRAFWSATGQLPYQTERLLVRMLSIALL